MRRDQIWFTSKNDFGETSLYSLAEFKIRNDKSFEKDYLGGIYGGIPILKDFSFKGEQQWGLMICLKRDAPNYKSEKRNKDTETKFFSDCFRR